MVVITSDEKVPPLLLPEERAWKVLLTDSRIGPITDA